MTGPTDDQFRAIARKWAEHWGGSVAENARVRRTQYGASVSCRDSRGKHFAKPVMRSDAERGYSDHDREQIRRIEASLEIKRRRNS